MHAASICAARRAGRAGKKGARAHPHERKERGESPARTTTLIVPWMTKCSSAGAQMVWPPSSKRWASGNQSTTDSTTAARAIGHGIVTKQQQVDGDKWRHREQAPRQNDRPAGAGRRGSRGREFLRRCLPERTARERTCPTGHQRSRRAGDEANTRTTSQSRRTTATAIVRPLARGRPSPSFRMDDRLVVRRSPTRQRRRGHDDSGDDDARLTSVAPECVRRPVKQGEYHEQPEQLSHHSFIGRSRISRLTAAATQYQSVIVV